MDQASRTDSRRVRMHRAENESTLASYLVKQRARKDTSKMLGTFHEEIDDRQQPVKQAISNRKAKANDVQYE